jgi:agmatinase
MAHHRPRDSLQAPRFTGVRTFMRLPSVQTLVDVAAVVVGVPTDSAVSYRPGARFGPEAIRSASVLLRDYNPILEVNVPDVLSMVDYGDAPTIPGYHPQTLAQVQRFLEPIYAQGVVPLVLGGDHSLTIAELRAAAASIGRLAVIHFDAHGDVLDDYYGVKHFHGTVFRRAVEEGLLDPAHSIQVGMRGTLHANDRCSGEALGYQVMYWEQLRLIAPAELAGIVRLRVAGRPVIVSFDIDFVDPAFAPGTGTPEVGGPTSYEALSYLRALGPLDYRGFDLVEVAPVLDPAGITSVLAASVCFEMLSLLALSFRHGHLGG